MPAIRIDDQNWQAHVTPPTGFSRGYEARRAPYGSIPCAAVAETMPLIPRSEWRDRIRQKEKDKSRLTDHWRDAGKPCFDQDGIPYCHANSAAMAVMMIRVVMNEPFVLLSPASIGGPVTGYKKQGAVIEDDLQVLAERGCCTQEFLGPNEINKAKNESPAATANAALHKVTEWWDFGYRNEIGTDAMLDRCATAALNNIPVPTGYDWWGHSTLILDLIYDEATGLWGFDELNSWGPDYGEGGLFRLVGNKAIPDAAYAPRVTGASNQ